MTQCTFPYKNFVKPLEKSLSLGRLELYEKLADNKVHDALKLYCWNADLSQALYWPLHAFEVTLRNAMADSIADAYGDDWYERIPTFSTSRRTIQSEEEKRVDNAKEKLDKNGIKYGHDAIVAAITFGFWTGLLKEEYKLKLWDPLFSTIFPMIGLKEAFEKAYYIKDLRNNIAHYEPIIVFPKGDKRELFRDYKLILKLLRWICPQTAEWVEHHSADKFFTAWNSCPEFFNISKLKVDNEGAEFDSQNWRWK